MAFEFPTQQFEPKNAGLELEAKRIFKSDFDAAVAGFDGVIQEHTVGFAEARWPKVGLEPWLFTAQGVTKAAVLVMVQPLPLKLGHIAVVKWGPLLADETPAEAGEIEATVITFLKAHYAIKRTMMLSVMAKAPNAESPKLFVWLLAHGFDAAEPVAFPARYQIKLRLSDADQRKSFAPEWLDHLNKAEKNGLTFEVAGAEHLQRFQRLYVMSSGKNFPDYSAYQTLPHMFANLPETLQPQLFFITHEGADVAGAIVFKAGRTAAYLYGAINDQGLAMQADYLLHARIISWLRDNMRAHWYDLGGTDGFQVVHQFKKGMVGTAGRIVDEPALANFAATDRAWVVGHTAYKLREVYQRLRARITMLLGRYAKPDQAMDDEAA